GLVSREIRLDQLNVMALAALQTLRISGVAVEFDDLFGRDAGTLMKPVDVLGDDMADNAATNERRNRMMPPIGLRDAHRLVGLDLAAPGFTSRLDRRDKVLIVDGLETGPDAAWAAKVGDSGLCADTRAGEDHCATGIRDHLAELVYRR